MQPKRASEPVGFVFEERPSDSPAVEKIWRNESGAVTSFLSVARPNWLMVFARQYGRTAVTLHGPETRATLAHCPEEAEFLGIQFTVGAFMPSVPVHRLVDGDIELPEASGTSFWLDGDAWEVPSFENADTFVARLVRAGLVAHDPAVDAVLHGDSPNLSARSMQRRFLKTTGLTHSAIRQIRRAQETTRLLRRGAPILDVIEQAGYFDQSHLTHALKRFTGQTPAQTIASPAPISIF
jgi:hypothetical protein